MENDNIQQSLKLFIVMSRAHRSINDIVNKHIAEAGLNPTEFAVLELLYHKGDQPLQQIGGKILLASGSITYVVDKLEQKEFLQRIACKDDRRVTFAKITDKGKAFIESVFPAHEKRIDDIMSALTKEEKATAIELLKKIGYSAKQ